MIEACWRAVGGDPAALDGLELSRTGQWLGSPLPVDELATGAIGAALLAAAELAQARTGHRPAVTLSGEHAALAFQSERHGQLHGGPLGVGFAPLSRFVRCREEGWARTHANYPHHAAALRRALGIEEDPAALEAAAAELEATALEDAIVAAGGCAAARRTRSEWETHPAGAVVSAERLIAYEETAVHGPHPEPLAAERAATPAAGIRVLDLTRVIAGPVAGRTLAALGAEVLRIDPPELPEITAQQLDTGPGKRAALLDLADAERREALLARADVLLIGYRAGSTARFGLDPDALAERHPQLVTVAHTAWGWSSSWAQRRGFDSLVQVACGIADLTARPDGRPGRLPAQALDHGTGHLIAAAALHGLTQRARGLPHHPARLSLARTAHELLAAPRAAEPADERTGTANAASCRVSFGELALIAPPGALDGAPLAWAHGPHPIGSDAPRWLDR